MGGNVSVNRNGQVFKAQKIDLTQVGLCEFRAKVLTTIAKLNKMFKEEYGEFLWNPNGAYQEYFNGSASFVLNLNMEPSELLKYKPLVGDIDIVVPDTRKKELFSLLKKLENKQLLSYSQYIGSNKLKSSSIGNQINSIFEFSFQNGENINVQFDFEFVEFEGDKPTEWAMFSHNSDFRDAKLGIKAVNHKYLIRALVGALSYRPDVAIATASSCLGSVTLSKSVRDRQARMLKFSVGRGLREAYEPILDENGKVLYMDGKYIYKMTNSKESEYITNIDEMVMRIFSLTQLDDLDYERFYHFGGLVDLLHKYTSKEVQQEVHDRYLHLLWKPENGRAQELEAGDPDADLKAKLPGYKFFVNKLGLEDKSEAYTKEYYKTYGQRKG
ncbi:hypothetical protein Va1_161 [Vibrio phage Va1]|nr:hypothetical protein Va1_161 [Vibrio phage Va1]